MTGFIKSMENYMVIVDTEEDILFATDSSNHNRYYFYSESGAYYAANKSQDGTYIILKLTIKELIDSIDGAVIVNDEIGYKFAEEINEKV